MATTAARPRAPGPVPRPAIHVTYASFESRVAAVALDLLVLVIIASLLVAAGSLIVLISSDFERTPASSTAINAFWACVVAIPPVYALYFFFCLALRGQTAGAAIMQLMVVRSDGRPLGVFGAIARVIAMLVYLLFIGIGLVVAYAYRNDTAIAAGAIAAAFGVVLIGVLWAAFDPHRRTLHDRIAGTIVVHGQ